MFALTCGGCDAPAVQANRPTRGGSNDRSTRRESSDPDLAGEVGREKRMMSAARDLIELRLTDGYILRRVEEANRTAWAELKCDPTSSKKREAVIRVELRDAYDLAFARGHPQKR